MGAVVDDCLAPREFIVPIVNGTADQQPKVSGALFISGALLYFHAGTNRLVTSS